MQKENTVKIQKKRSVLVNKNKSRKRMMNKTGGGKEGVRKEKLVFEIKKCRGAQEERPSEGERCTLRIPSFSWVNQIFR